MTRPFWAVWRTTLVIIVLAFGASGCGYNRIVE